MPNWMIRAFNPRAFVVSMLERVRQANVRMVSLFLAIAWVIYLSDPERQITSIDDSVVSQWMTVFSIAIAPSVMARTPMMLRRAIHFVIAVHWLAWAAILSAFERYDGATTAGQWMIAAFSTAAMVQSFVTDEEDERRKHD